MRRRTAIKNGLALTTLTFWGAPFKSIAATANIEPDKLSYDASSQLQFWLETSLKRVYPNSQPGEKKALKIIAAKNERVSFQACVRNFSTDSAVVKCELIHDTHSTSMVRRVGYVPVIQLNTFTPKSDLEGIGHIPGLCPDPLFPEEQVHIGPESNGVFWITLRIPENIKSGKHTFSVKFTLVNRFAYNDFTYPNALSVTLPVEIDVRSLVIQPRKNFPVTNWISIDSIWEYYKIEPCGDRFWELADKFIENLVSHGNNAVYTPIWNNRHELLIRPAQLLRVKKIGKDKFEFDFTDVRKWVRLALKHGAEYIEWAHFFTPAPTSGKHPQRIYEKGEGAVGKILWDPDISATSETFRSFLSQFVPVFKQFLEEEGILDKSLFHCADEPDGEAQIEDYKKARALLREFAPWMKVMDALSDTKLATLKLVENPIPSILTAANFKAINLDTWVYFCCGPREGYLQRLMDTPLSKIRMCGLLFYKLGATGFLHWGYSYWFKFCTSEISDPFVCPDIMYWPILPIGDPFVVYPGNDGPLDSIRWENFAEGLQDFALLQSANIKPDDPLLAEIKGYANFPKTEEWYINFRRKLLEQF
ncbi:MAG: DUF4091 domain-containing protein [Petrimonas sp.]|jgi:hypothetical protein